MATINGKPYTSFRAVNAKNGYIRLEDPFKNTTYVAKHPDNYGVRFSVDSTSLSANRKVYLGDGSGSMMITGYDILYGTSTFLGNDNIVAQSIGQASATITGVLTSCIVLVSAATSAQVAGYVPIGSSCKTAGSIWVFYKTQAATAAASVEVPFNYTILFPQTS
jgi:hypothetical protein